MKHNLRRLRALVKLCGEDAFYNFDLTTATVRAQGYYKADLLGLLIKHKFKYTVFDSGYINCTRGNYQIFLT